MIRLDDIIGEGMSTASVVAEHLIAADGAPVDMVINSPGGNAFEGAAIVAEMEAYPGQITVHVRGIAASAASLIAVAGDVIEIDGSGVMMIHEPGAMTFGTSADHRSAADTLEMLSGVYAETYARFTGSAVPLVRRWMANETWMTADEAVALNFADKIAERREPEMVAKFDYTEFAHAPRELIAMARAEGWATPSPIQQ